MSMSVNLGHFALSDCFLADSVCRSLFRKAVFASYRGSMHIQDCFDDIEDPRQEIDGLDMWKRGLNAILPSC